MISLKVLFCDIISRIAKAEACLSFKFCFIKSSFLIPVRILRDDVIVSIARYEKNVWHAITVINLGNWLGNYEKNSRSCTFGDLCARQLDSNQSFSEVKNSTRTISFQIELILLTIFLVF